MDETKKPEVKRVTEGSVKVSPKFSMGALMHDFIQEDIHTVASSIFTDIIYPKTKQMVYDAIVGAVGSFFWGASGLKKPSASGTLGTRVNYNGVSSQRTTNTGASLTSARTSGVNPSDVEFESRDDAVRVLDSMLDVLEQYEQISVVDFYEFAGLPCNNFTLRDYGWKNLSTCVPKHNGNGSWSIPFPKMIKL